MQIRWGLRTRMILSTTTVLVASFVVAFLWGMYNLRAVLEARNDQFLKHKLAEFTSIVHDSTGDSLTHALEVEMRHEVEAHAEVGFVIVLRRAGTVRVLPDSGSTQDLARTLEAVELNSTPRDVHVAGQQWPYRAVRLALPIPEAEQYVVELGLRGRETHETLANFGRRVATGGAVFFVLAVFGGFWLTRQALAPIAESISTARVLSPDDLTARLPRSGAGDELDLLAGTINDLLDRLARYHEQVIRFTADASHELRGPLAAMRAAVEISLQKPRVAEDYREVLESLGEQCEQLTDLINKLLLLAKADAGEIPLQREELDLAGLVSEMTEMYQPLADEKGVALHWNAAAPLLISGDRLRLRQLVSNLLDNALKFTDRGGTITLTAEPSQTDVKLTVADTGLGIPAERLPQIFERFYQADEFRSGKGCGLGLAICRWVADAHGGAIDATSRLGEGTCFTVILSRD